MIARFVCERYEDGLVKPWTMLWLLISVDELSCDPTCCEGCESSVATVDAELSSSVACEVHVCGVALDEASSRSNFDRIWDVLVDGGSAAGSAGVGIGSSIGSRRFVSLMDVTIFSRSIGVMCFSRPRLRVLSPDSFRLRPGRARGMRGVVVCDVECTSKSSSDDEAESSDDESAGIDMSPLVAAVCGIMRRCWEGRLRESGRWDSGAQQNVSLFHSRQLRFSSRLPSSIACEVLENSDHCAAGSTR